MKKMKFWAIAMGIAVVMSCSTKAGTGTLIGAGGGAVLGAVIGKLAGNTGVGAAIGTAVGAGAGALIGNHMDKVAAKAKQIEGAQVETVQDDNGLTAVKLTFGSGILFNTNSAELSSASKSSLYKLANLMKENGDCYVDLRGYTDRSGGDRINIPLSQRRADAVKDYLTLNGVPESQLKNVEGRGSQDEIEDLERSEKNRRVEVYLYASQAMIDAANNGTLD
ncbi:MAG: OmpA family protein [Prevotella sp.]|nr:OmpA family protein [Prevotella sp.]MCR5152938.1 OmpA family protein [Prevotella sp.]